MKYKLFIDSIILKIKYQSLSHEYDYNNITSYLLQNGYKRTNRIKNNYIAKFNKMYLVRNPFGKILLEVFSFSDDSTNKSIFFLYALKQGLYIEVNGIVQYENDYRKDKLKLLNKIWNTYECSISKLDISVDIECKFQDMKVYDKKFELLTTSKKSNEGIHYYLEGSYSKIPKQRRLKAYMKSYQRFREFPLAMDLSRIELTLKSQKLKGLMDIEGLTERVCKEFTYYKIKIKQKELFISKIDISDMFISLFSNLQDGKNSKKYSNFYKNIDTKVSSMRLAWESLSKNITVVEFIKNHPIAMTALKQYRSYYVKNS
jgi:hypothetical protein